MNAGRIERSAGDFHFYEEGVTPAVVRVIEAVDRERRRIGDALGLTLTPVAEAFHAAGFGPAGDLWATINGCSDAPPTVVPGRDKTCTTWQGCEAPTELCVVHGMPHAWPAPWGQKAAPVDATTEGWAWFLGLPPR